MNYLLDTCLLSELHRAEPDPGVAYWVEQTDEHRLYVAALSLGEIQKGVAKLDAGRKKQQIQDWLDQELRRRFVERILAIDEKVALEWGILLAADRNGQPLPVIDSLIAAVAVVNNLAIVTRNVRDFETLPIRLINPWE